MYVGISQRFMSDVRSNIHNMHRKEKQALGVNDAPTLAAAPDWLIEAIWGQHLHLKLQMPLKWMPVCEHFNVRLKDDMTDYTLPLCVPAVHMPPGSYGGYGAYTVRAVDAERLLAHPEIVTWLAKAKELIECDKRWDNVMAQVTTFFNKCKSVNEALKAWPDCKMYIDQEYLDKVELKREVVKSESRIEEAMKGLDTDSLVAATVIARMSDSK